MTKALDRRARQRRNWPVLLTGLHDQAGADLSASTTLAERLAMMRPLALAAWKVAGLPLPRYSRRRIPVRIFDRDASQEGAR
jgi:hypothetical protein